MPDGAGNRAERRALALSRACAEPDILSSLYTRHCREIVAYVRRQVGVGPPEPEDVAQQAFANFAALDNIGEVRNPRAFLYRIAANIVTNHRRRDKIARTYAAEVKVVGFSQERDEFSPEIVLLDREQLSLVEATIRKLPSKQRRYLLMNRLDGLGYSEIARKEGLNESVVRRHVAKAMRAIVATLETDDDRSKP